MPPFFICEQVVNKWKKVLTINKYTYIINTRQNDWRWFNCLFALNVEPFLSTQRNGKKLMDSIVVHMNVFQVALIVVVTMPKHSDVMPVATGLMRVISK